MTVCIHTLSVSRIETASDSLRSRLMSRTTMSGVVALAMVGAVPEVQATPANPTVISGGITFATRGAHELDITQTTAKAIINWQSFSIAAGEVVRFFQPNAGSIVLNRVTGGSRSDIMGWLTGNGNVWIVNPAGVFFGPSSHVSVAGLIATTHDIRNSDFIAGRYQFQSNTQPTGIIENQGNITATDAGLVAFVAPGIVNHGIITARLGEVTLASGNDFTVDFYGDQKINLALSNEVVHQVLGNNGQPLTSLVHNDGHIFADGGLVQMTAAAARGVVDTVINNGGIIQARSVEQHNGKIILAGDDAGAVVNSGTLDASGRDAGQTGGTVLALGQTVALTATSRIDVSGAVGGGDVLIGGEFRGGNATAADYIEYATHPTRKPAVPNAALTVVEDGATITADAIVNGAGGKVVVWADEVNSYHGSISARGGAQGGNGGFVEVSGHQLDFQGTADRQAPAGQDGTLLLDPNNVTIFNGIGNSLVSLGSGTWCSGVSNIYGAVCGSGIGFGPNANNSIISPTQLDILLSGGNVAIVTDYTPNFGAQVGNITFASNFSWNGSHSLLISADGGIDIRGITISHVGSGSLILNTNEDGGRLYSLTSNASTRIYFSASTGYAVLTNANYPPQIDWAYGGRPFVWTSSGVTYYDGATPAASTTQVQVTQNQIQNIMNRRETISAPRDEQGALADLSVLNVNSPINVLSPGVGGTTPMQQPANGAGVSGADAGSAAGAVVGSVVGANIAGGANSGNSIAQGALSNITTSTPVITVLDAIIPNSGTIIGSVYQGGYISPPGTDVKAKEECVNLVKGIDPGVGATRRWRAGQALSDLNGNYPIIAPGTPIATFRQDMTYPQPDANNHVAMDTQPIGGGSLQPHAAIFLSYITENGRVIGMNILEQSDQHPAHVGQRLFEENANYTQIPVANYTYSVVQN